VISTKKNIVPADHPDPDKAIRDALEQSLIALGTDYVDVYHVHGAEPKDYRNARERHLPTLLRLREEGKIRAVGITERFVLDSSHAMLEQALHDHVWDVIMVGFNLLNPCARRNILPMTRTHQVGVLVSYALRRALSQPERLKKLCADLVSRGAIPADALNPDEPLDFLLSEGGATSIQDAAYRFCRHEPGVDIVLTGTGNPAHLKSNVESLLQPALPAGVRQRLQTLFGNLDSLTGNY
ncbi:MAG TPA: aldo/keto reductase, partial [Candidatus Binatus sp.]|nr:aldo/keto reductase [Candidatus Binatus sp.]